MRIAFCDNQSWLPIASFFGLVGCPIPSTLKAGLLDALASFAKSPEICTVLWQSLEATQVFMLFCIFIMFIFFEGAFSRRFLKLLNEMSVNSSFWN